MTGFIPIHYFVQDRSGAAVVFQPAGERLAVTAGEDLPVPALTNAPYAELRAGLARFAEFGGTEPLPASTVTDDPVLNSLARFGHASLAVTAHADGLTEAEGFAALDGVRNHATQWQILFDPGKAEVAYRPTSGDKVHRLSLREMPPDCVAPPLAAALDGTEARPITRAELLAVLTEAFGSFPQFQAFGPTLAADAADGQLASMRCAG